MSFRNRKTRYLKDGIGSAAERICNTLTSLRMEFDRLELFASVKREAHRRILLSDLLKIKVNLKKEKINNGVGLMINHFNEKIVHSLKTINACTLQDTTSEYEQLLNDVEYICNELTNRLIIDNSIPEYEKTILGHELYQFKNDAKAHVLEVDHFCYELRELVKGTSLHKLRGLTKEEYKEKIQCIIDFIENAEVPLHFFKSVGFTLKNTKEVVDNGTSGELDLTQEPDYFDDSQQEELKANT